MNALSFSGRFLWLPALAILALSAALLLCHSLVWTPLQRYYLGTYLECAWLGTDPALGTDVQWLYKTAPHEKKELAMDADVVPGSSGGERGVEMQLSPAARQAAWTGLMQGPDERLQTARLQTFLQAQFYAGQSIWRMLLTPLLLGAAMFCFLLAGLSAFEKRFPNNQRDMEAIAWGRPPPSLWQRWRTKVGRSRFRLPGFRKHWMPEIAPRPAPAAAHADPLKKAQPVLPFFSASTGKSNEGFAWDETNGIE